jgi:hypothetical protein
MAYLGRSYKGDDKDNAFIGVFSNWREFGHMSLQTWGTYFASDITAGQAKDKKATTARYLIDKSFMDDRQEIDNSSYSSPWTPLYFLDSSPPPPAALLASLLVLSIQQTSMKVQPSSTSRSGMNDIAIASFRSQQHPEPSYRHSFMERGYFASSRQERDDDVHNPSVRR